MVLATNALSAQNLIPHGGFEFADVQKYLYQHPPFLKTHRTRDATSIASNAYLRASRGELVPACYAGAHCAYVYVANAHRDKDGRFRSYIQVKLERPTQPDSLYDFRAALCTNGANPYLAEVPVYLMRENVYSREAFTLRLPPHQRLVLPVGASPDWQTPAVRFRADAAYPYLLIGEAEGPGPVATAPDRPRVLRSMLFDELELRRVEAVEKPVSTPPEAREVVVYFDSNAAVPSTTVDWSSYIDAAAPPIGITIMAYADTRGQTVANEALSRRRAEAIRTLLVRDYALSPDSFTLAWRGEQDCVQVSAACRRAEVRFVYR